MNPELIKFIELCLADGSLSEKEKEVIFRKADQLGVPKDECEIILEGMLINSASQAEEIEPSPQNLDLKEIASMDKQFLENLTDYLNELNEAFEENISVGGANVLFQKWYSKFSSNLVQDSEIHLGNRKYNLFFDSEKEIRWCDAFFVPDELRNKLNRNINEKAIAIGTDYNRNSQTLFLADGFQEISISEKDGFFGRKIDLALGRFFTLDNVDITNFNDPFWMNKLYFLLRGFDNDYTLFRDFHDKISQLKFQYNAKGYLAFLENKSYYGADILAKLNAEIESKFYDIKQFAASVDYADIHPFDDYSYGKRGYNQNLFSVLDYIVLGMKSVTSLIEIKNQLLIAVLSEEIGTIDYIKENLDSKGILLSFYQKEKLKKLDDLIQVMKEGFEKLSNSIGEIGSQMNQMNNTLNQRLQSIDETIQVGNLMSGIQAYQLYKINRNTKS